MPARRTMHARAIGAVSLGGLLFGFDTAVISGATEALRQTWSLSPGQLGTLVSAALWGTLAGALFAGQAGDRHGSLAVLRGVGLFYIVSAAGCALASAPLPFTAFRFIGGLAIGASSVLVPVYIAEISPAERRGRLVGLFQLNIVIGILVAYLSNFLVGQALTGDIVWRVKLATAALPAALFLLLLLGVPQSPAWLAARGRMEESEQAAVRLGVAVQQPIAPFAGDARLSWHAHRRPMLLAVTVALFNQLSGINAILYYLNDIFAAAGFGQLSADGQAVVVGFANLLGTVAGVLLIDRVGRRPLLIGGGLVTGAALAGVALVFGGMWSSALLLPLLALFILAFAVSQGAVIWVYLSEIFPAPVRARGQSLGSSTHWAANAIISFAFPVLAGWSRAGPFWLFGAAMLAQAVIVWRFFPETKRRALDEVSADIVHPRTGFTGEHR
jgi:sugar porter (SP) family MFS transporter